MAIQKPLPLQLGNRFYYTLSSYDPVSITVPIAQVTDADVLMSMGAYVEQAGGDLRTIDDAWVREHYPAEKGQAGIGSVREFADAMRQAVQHTNEEMSEARKPALCAQALAERLNQRVPPEAINEARAGLRQSFEAELAQEGATLTNYLQATGLRSEDIDAMLQEQAEQVAQQDAALDAYAEKQKIVPTEQELPGLLRLPTDQCETIVSQAKAAGRYDDVQRAAARNKVALLLARECHATYQRESDEEAAQRREGYRSFERQMGIDLDELARKFWGTDDEGPRLKLV